jgi:hypothetical protein
MSRRDLFIAQPAIIIFLSHGLLYYIYPEQHYLNNDGAGWISFIKYACVLAALTAIARERIPRSTVTWLILGISLTSAPFIPQIFWASNTNALLLQLQVAMLGYFFAPTVIEYYSNTERLRQHLLFTIVLSSIASFMEIILGSPIDNFSRSGFRSIGAFVNPNNTGILIAIAATAYQRLSHNSTTKVVVIAISALSILLSGSKTALIIYSIGLFLSLSIISIIGIVTFSTIGVIVYFDLIVETWSLIELREISFESGDVRTSSLSNLLLDASNRSVREIIFGYSSQSVIDNAYLDALSFGGLFSLSIILSFQITSIILLFLQGNTSALIVQLMILLAMLSTNIPRLWPTGYIFWLLVGVSLYNQGKAFNRINPAQS